MYTWIVKILHFLCDICFFWLSHRNLTNIWSNFSLATLTFQIPNLKSSGWHQELSPVSFFSPSEVWVLHYGEELGARHQGKCSLHWRALSGFVEKVQWQERVKQGWKVRFCFCSSCGSFKFQQRLGRRLLMKEGGWFQSHLLLAGIYTCHFGLALLWVILRFQHSKVPSSSYFSDNQNRSLNLATHFTYCTNIFLT